MRWTQRLGWVGVAALMTLGGCGQEPARNTLRPATLAPSSPARPSDPSPAVPTGIAAPLPTGSSTSAGPPTASGSGGEECEYVESGTPARPVRPPSARGVPDSGTVTYVLAMTEGNVTITLDRARAPCTVHSFESLAAQGYFDRTRCHRLVDSAVFFLQCGDPTATGQGGPGYTFLDETDGTETYQAGVVAMANAGRNTNGSQFLLFYDESTLLDDEREKYTIFGEMTERSRGVVARMAAEGQDGKAADGGGRPNNEAEIARVTRQ